MPQTTIAPAEVSAALATGQGVLIDVRTPAEFEEVHAPAAKLIPLDILDRPALDAARGPNAGPVYLICASGIRATKAAEKLSQTGLKPLVVAGGTQAWSAAGLPVIRGRKTISVERQVRIGAGAFVLLGIALGYLINSRFFLLSGFVGAGLVFAGLTDICGMAILLARAPWNRSSRKS